MTEDKINVEGNPLFDLADLEDLDLKLHEMVENLKTENDKNTRIGIKIEGSDSSDFYKQIEEAALEIKKKIEELDDQKLDADLKKTVIDKIYQDTRQLDETTRKQATLLEDVRIRYLANYGVNFDYKDFVLNYRDTMIDEIVNDSKDKDGEPTIKKDSFKNTKNASLIPIIEKVVRNRAKKASARMRYHSKKIIEDDYIQFAETKGCKTTKDLLTVAADGDKLCVDFTEQLKQLGISFGEIGKYTVENINPKCHRLVTELLQYVENDQIYKDGKLFEDLNPSKKDIIDQKLTKDALKERKNKKLLPVKELGKHDQIRRGIKEDLARRIRNGDWLDTYNAVDLQLQIYDAEKDRLQYKYVKRKEKVKNSNTGKVETNIKKVSKERLFKDTKRVKMLEAEKEKLETYVQPLLKKLIPYQPAILPTDDIQSYLTNVNLRLYEDGEKINNFFTFMDGELEKAGIDLRNSDGVKVEIEYIPITQDVGGKKMAYNIQDGACALKVSKKKTVTNNIHTAISDHFNDVNVEIPSEHYEAVIYLGLVKDREFYRNVKGEKQ